MVLTKLNFGKKLDCVLFDTLMADTDDDDSFIVFWPIVQAGRLLVSLYSCIVQVGWQCPSIDNISIVLCRYVGRLVSSVLSS